MLSSPPSLWQTDFTYLKVIGLVMPHPAHEHVERIAAVDCGLDFLAVARERAGAESA